MNLQSLFSAHAHRPVRVAVAGVGEFGASLAGRGRRGARLQVDVLADALPERALARLQRSGIDAAQVSVCESREAALRGLELGRKVLLTDPALLAALPVDVVVEATGHAESAAATAELAIKAGKHVAMATKEADSVVGPMLDRLARRAGVVYTPVDGDQPSLLIKLVAWAGELGARVVAAGKASEFDFVFDPVANTVSSQGRTVATPRLHRQWDLPAQERLAALAERQDSLRGIGRISVPDLCEMGIVANATGLRPDCPGFHAPVARTLELPDLFCTRRDGGLFEREGVVDTFNCLRRNDEISFAGGVFVVVDIGDDAGFRVLRDKGIPASREGSRLLLYNPTHLLGVEATISILSAVLLGQSTLGDDYRPRFDLSARAARDLPAGTTFEIAHQHTHSMADLQPVLLDAAPLAPGAALPYYLAVGCRLARPLRAGELLSVDAVDAPATSVLWRLRREQDDAFFGASPIA